MEAVGKRAITQDKIMEILGKCYSAAVNGLPGTKSCDELANQYLTKYPDVATAMRKFISMQVAKCSTSGFMSGLGGLLVMALAVPANISSVLYVQLRMIATIAVMNGYDLYDDEVQTMVYLCLVGASIVDVCKAAGVQVANKVTINLLKKLPGTMISKINQKVGFRLLTKFGEKGIVNLVKVVPVAGGIVGGGVDYFGTKYIAKKAIENFSSHD